MKKLLCLLTLIIISLGCTKEDDNNTDIVDQNGGDVYRYQITSIELPNSELAQNEYNASFGDIPVKVIKIDAHTIGFSVPSNADLGNTDLVIPELNSATIHYNVLQPVLTNTPDETVADFITLGDSFIANETIPEPNNNYEKFRNFYNNNATNEQKEQIAYYYYVNKEQIDHLITFDPENPNGRFTADDAIIISKFLTAILAGGTSVWITYSQIPANPAGAVLGAGAVYFFYKKAKSYGYQVTTIADIKTTELSIDGFSGTNNRNPQSMITLEDEVASQFPFQIQNRALIQSDANTTNATVSSFFEKLDYFNDFINKTNSAITWINNNIPFVNFSTMDLVELQTNPASIATNVDTEAMQNISFSINHSNLQLINANLSSEGQLNLKVKIVGTQGTTPIVSTLNYSYTDGLSDFSGTFPITVTSEFLVGNWTLFEINNLSMGEWDMPDCPKFRYLSSGNTINFTSTSLSGVFSSEYQGTETDQNGNTVCSPSEFISDSLTGDYELNGSTSYIIMNGNFVDGDGESAVLTGTISIINSNTIQVNLTADWGGGEISNVSCKYTR